MTLKPDKPVKLTKERVDRLKHPAPAQKDPVTGKREDPQYLVYDLDLKGFGIRVTPGSKSYFAEARVAGKTCRYTIGKHGVFTADAAREQAKIRLGEMAKGINPNTVKNEKRIRSITLQELWGEYQKARQLRDKTKRVYESALNRCFHDWLSKPITSITKDMVQKRHKKLSEDVGERSNPGGAHAQANQAMATLRSLLNYAAAKYEDADGKSILPENPVKRLSQTDTWNTIKRRKTVITKSQLKPWFDAVESLTNDTTRDYFIMCLLTGLRRTEAASLKWCDVNLKEGWLCISEDTTKNHEEHRMPLSDYLISMLQARQDANRELELQSIYVFPSPSKTGCCLAEPKSAVKSICKKSGVRFMVHDLRRTFLTIGESIDIPHYALKRLANHKMTQDVTAGYVVSNVERLRVPMQAITDYILEQAERKTKVEPVNTTVAVLTDNYQRLESV